MRKYICIVCGVQYAETDKLPSRCPICEDERQWVHQDGQKWTTLEDMRLSHGNHIESLEPSLISIRTEPLFAIAQQAYLVQTKSGNVLWDCISLIDQATIDAVNVLGGISAIAISHPHFYSSMTAWSKAFNNAPIYLHSAEKNCVMDPHPSIIYWEGDCLKLNDELTLIRCGGHFQGSSVLHWAKGAEGKGALLSGDTIMVVMDSRYVSFMYSFPNLIPLSEQKIRGILKAIDPLSFDRIYSGWAERVCKTNAKKAVAVSAERYISHLYN